MAFVVAVITDLLSSQAGGNTDTRLVCDRRGGLGGHDTGLGHSRK